MSLQIIKHSELKRYLFIKIIRAETCKYVSTVKCLDNLRCFKEQHLKVNVSSSRTRQLYLHEKVLRVTIFLEEGEYLRWHPKYLIIYDANISFVIQNI